MRRLLLGACVASGLLGSGCITTAPTRPLSNGPARASASSEPPPDPRWSSVHGLPSREQAVERAREMLGRSSVRVEGKHYPDDCTGLVRGVFDSLGVGLLADARPGDNGVTSIYRFVQDHGHLFTGGRPLPGDLVFFHDTYDQNHDGRLNDGLTHVGLVEGVDADGTVSIIHRVRRGVVRFRMNLEHPAERTDSAGQVLNDYLRAKGNGTRSVLTGELFAAYGSVLPTQVDEPTQTNLPVLRPQPEGGSI